MKTSSAKVEKGSPQPQAHQHHRCNPISSRLIPKCCSEQQAPQQAHATQGSNSNATNSNKNEKRSLSQQQDHQQTQGSQGSNSNATTNSREEEQGSLSQQQAHQPDCCERLVSLMPCTDELIGRKNGELKPPHNYVAILENSDLKLLARSLYKSCLKNVIQQLHTGVFLYNRQQKYWVDKRENNCFMIFANGLKIKSVENPSCWYLHTAQTSDHGLITVATLRKVDNLEVQGKLDIANLTPGLTYEVAFMIMLEYTSDGWSELVNLELTPPGESKRVRQEKLNDKSKGEWFLIHIGELNVPLAENKGVVEFSLCETKGSTWKKGLVVQGAVFKPIYKFG